MEEDKQREKEMMNSEIQTWDKCTKVSEPKEYINQDFVSEKELTEYIDKYAQLFARDVLEIDYLSHKKEFYLGTGRGFKCANTAHADFLFTSKTGENILIECKHPRFVYSEVRNGIVQLMAYYCDCKKYGFKVDRMCLVTTKFDIVLRDVIKEFNIPVEVYVFGKNTSLKMMNGN